MRQVLPLLLLFGGATAASPAIAQHAKDADPVPAQSPGEIVAAAPDSDWRAIAADDLLIMTLAPDARGKARTVVIQLIPAPISQGWVSNINAIAKAHWWDGTSVYRVQDNYVAQWGEPEEDSAKAKSLPQDLKTVPEADYLTNSDSNMMLEEALSDEEALRAMDAAAAARMIRGGENRLPARGDAYADWTFFGMGWPLATNPGDDPQTGERIWPIHCYGAVGVARGMSPNTGTGSDLYAVIGHAPRHLDRNIAVVGRIIEGMEQVSSLPRGPAPLGIYEKSEERTSILSVRLASDLPAGEQPHFQYLSTKSESFGAYAEARANRRDPFFLVPAGGADICNIPVPIRRRP